ncbi:MAG: hypothetical protein GF387_01995 [Candidatus Portnoybacteria bacterium]|nr:hypothetical protein [Candidatus Portnoybacteria bacterium]
MKNKLASLLARYPKTPEIREKGDLIIKKRQKDLDGLEEIIGKEVEKLGIEGLALDGCYFMLERVRDIVWEKDFSAQLYILVVFSAPKEKKETVKNTVEKIIRKRVVRDRAEEIQRKYNESCPLSIEFHFKSLGSY